MLLKTLSLRLATLLAALLFVLPSAAQAAVEITFYAREMGTQFPHAFVRLEGTPDRGGERIDTNYGFTATHVSPSILFGSVRGEVSAVGEGYIRASDPFFKMTLSDSEYDQVMEVVARYRETRQPSYNLNRRNCVHFISEVAAALGMEAELPRNLTRRPNAFTELLIRENRDWLRQRNATVMREAAEERPGQRPEQGRRPTRVPSGRSNRG